MSVIGTGLPLQLWRYANGIPLLDYKDDVPTCALSAAIRTINWKKFGHALRVKLCMERMENDSNCLFETSSLVLVPKRMDPEAFSYAPEFDATDISTYSSSHKSLPMQAAIATSAINEPSVLESKKGSMNCSNSHNIRYQKRGSNLLDIHNDVQTYNKRKLDGSRKELSRSCRHFVVENSIAEESGDEESGDVFDRDKRKKISKLSSIGYHEREENAVDSEDQSKEVICRHIDELWTTRDKRRGSLKVLKFLPSQMIILLDVRTVAGSRLLAICLHCIIHVRFWKF